MKRLVTDNPNSSTEICMNYAYVMNSQVYLRYGDENESPVSLVEYIAKHSKDLGCVVTADEVMVGDSCLFDCDCPLAVLNAVAIQAAELRERLRKYEDAEEQGVLA